MNDSNIKCWFITVGVVLAVPSIGLVITAYSEHSAKRDIIIACYQAGTVDCDKIWNKEIK